MRTTAASGRGRRPRPALRPVEFSLGFIAVATGLVAAIPVSDPGAPLRAAFGRPLALAAVFFVLHVLLTARLPRADPILGPTVLLLMGLGMAFSRRLAPALDEKQFAWLLLGAAVMAFAAVGPIHLRWFRRYPYSIGLAGVMLVAATLVAGRAAMPGGPRLWLAVGPFQFQPSEVLKLVVVIFLAGYLANRAELLSMPGPKLGFLRLPPVPYLAPLAIMLGAGLTLVAAQRDLGAALLLYLIGLGMLYIASGRAGYVVFGVAAFLLGAAVLNARLPIVATRTAIWRDPWTVADSTGYQVVQATMALAAGGLGGTGLGQGMPDAIPAVHTDFVYAAVAEELGVAGAAAVLLLYGVLFARGWRTALRASSLFEALLAAGLTLALAVQTIVIVGGILRLIPLTGITLPFLSYGGTSLLTSAFAVGLILRISGREPGMA